MAKKKKKQPKLRKQTQRIRRARSIPAALADELANVERLTKSERWSEAMEILRSLDHRYPGRQAVLVELVDMCYELQNIQLYQYYLRRLAKVTPLGPDLTLGLAKAYKLNKYPALALQTFRAYLNNLKRYPSHERADEVRRTVATLEIGLQDILADFTLKYKDPLKVAAWHDEVRLLLAEGEFKPARKIAGQLLRIDPSFVSVLNNLSQVDMMEGNLGQATVSIERVLAIDPTNFQALGNAVHCYFLQGAVETAQARAETLRQLEQIEVGSSDLWLKRAEAFTYLGDDQAVLETLQGAEQAGFLRPPLANPVLYHFAAVAAMRLGEEAQAHQYWQEALKLDPHFDLARSNLDDLQKPVSEQHAPWPFSFRQWVSEQAVDDMITYWQPAIKRNSEEAMTQAARRYLKRHPEVIFIVPTLFERGDAQGRDFAFNLVKLAETEEMLLAMRDFALSQHGPDAMRYEAAQIVSKAGLMPAGRVPLWLGGQWQEVLLMAFEIHEEPTKKHPPQVRDLMAEANEALQRQDGRQAERILKQALKISPDAPEILNNLALSYQLQRRHAKSAALTRQIHRDHPDYLFSRVAIANTYSLEGQIEQAAALLEPLLARKRLHITEFFALCVAYIQLSLAQDAPEGAQHWLKMWADIDPDHPDLHYWRRQVRLYHKPKKSS